MTFKNEGKVDRILRVGLGLALLSLVFHRPADRVGLGWRWYHS